MAPDLSQEQADATGDPLEGLNYVLEKEKEIRNRAELLKELEEESTQVQRVVTTPIDEVDETDPQRAPYHNTLYRAAMEGKANEAEDVIREMIGLGIQPGPKAYHGLIFAYAKSNNSSGALNAVRRAHSSGLNPLTESYLVLIHTFMKEQNFKRAESVFRSMTRPDANVDIQAGWNMLTSLLFQNGSTTEAETLLEEGRNEEFLPNNKVFTESIKHNCKQGKIDSALEDLSEVLIYELYEEGDLHCTAEQIEPLLHHFATTGDLLMMLWLLQLPRKLTTACYNSILRSILTQWESKSEDLDETFQFVWEHLEDNRSVKGDLESMVFYLTAEILRGNALSAQKLFLHEQLADVEGLQKKQLVSDLLSRLLVALSSQGLPIAMHNLLLMLSITNLGVPESAFVPDSRGRTFVTQWLDGRLENIDKETQEDEDQDVNFTTDGRRIVIIEGVKIGFGNCVVDDEGEIVPLSSLRVSELRAECKARGLPHDGVRKELYENVKLSRRAMPSIKDEIKRKKQLTRKKAKMTGKKIRSASSKKSEEEPEVYHRVQYRHGKLIKTEILQPEFAVQLLSKAEPGQELDNLDDMNEEEAMIEALRVGDKPQIPEWSDVFTLTSRQNSNLGTDETAGANAVVAISALLWKLGGIPTLEDFEAMLFVIDQTRNPAAAWKLGNLITQETISFKTERVDPAEKKEEYHSRLRRIMHVCARICLTCGFPDSCEQLVTKMRELEIEPDQVLLQEIVQFREKGVTKLEGKYPSDEIETKPKSKDMVSLVVDPLRPIRTETLLEDEGEEEDDGETQSELERPTEMFPMSKPEDEEESLEGFGGLDQLETDTDDDTDSDDESLLADTEI